MGAGHTTRMTGNGGRGRRRSRARRTLGTSGLSAGPCDQLVSIAVVMTDHTAAGRTFIEHGGESTCTSPTDGSAIKPFSLSPGDRDGCGPGVGLTAGPDEIVDGNLEPGRGVMGIGPDTAVTLLITMGDNSERLHSEASFAALCGVSPVERSSGTRQYRRLNRGGDRQANAALRRIVQTRLRFDPRTGEPIPTRPEHAGGEPRTVAPCSISCH